MRHVLTIVLLACLCGGCGWTGTWKSDDWAEGRRSMLAELTVKARQHAEAVVQGREDGEAAWVRYYNSLEARREGD